MIALMLCISLSPIVSCFRMKRIDSRTLSELHSSLHTPPRALIESIPTNKDIWACSTSIVPDYKFSQSFRLTFSQAWDNRNHGFLLPDLCLIHYSAQLIEKSTDNNYLRVFDHILSNFPSIQTVVGLAIDNPEHEQSVSVSLGSFPGKQITALHVDKIVDSEILQWSRSVIDNDSFKEKSFLFFPHPTVDMGSMLQIIDTIKSSHPSCTVMGEILSSNLPQQSTTGFILERGFPNSTAVLMKSGLIAVGVSGSTSELKQKWPPWMQSLVTTLRWANVLGH